MSFGELAVIRDAMAHVVRRVKREEREPRRGDAATEERKAGYNACSRVASVRKFFDPEERSIA
jgi:hypothetical protein